MRQSRRPVPGFVLRLGMLLATVAAVVLGGAGTASAAGGSGYYVTFAARVCPSYGVIFANRARNDILQSLKDLGPDAQYNYEGFLVNPDAESEAPQNVCRPLPGWDFRLGTGIAPTVVGPWGALSVVSDPYGTQITTRASTPLLDQHGDPIGSETLPGAVTVQLTNAEREQAGQYSQLWAQGGLPDDPVLADRYPGPQYAFGALRCATDDLNGDNVEFIYFPTGVRHVFCYALYVEPPPTAGLITIAQRVIGAPAGQSPAFAYNGDLSYNPDGFQLGDGQSQDFFRAGATTWTATQYPVTDYKLQSVHCVAVTDTGGPGTSVSSVDGATTSIALVAGEHVTCTYTNVYVPPKGGLTIFKVTQGATGSFDFQVNGRGHSRLVTATTDVVRVPADATPPLPALAPGTYTIRERAVARPDGRWRLVRVVCNGARESTVHPVRVEVHSGQAASCTFVNRFIPAGSISISKITTGNVGTTAFLISTVRGTPAQYFQHATTIEPGVAEAAVPDTGGDATTDLRLGSYEIIEQSPVGGDPDSWALGAAMCNGLVEPFQQGTVQIVLTRQQPSVHCTFANTYTSQPPVVPPPTPGPPPVIHPPIPPAPPLPPTAGPDIAPIYATSNLVVTKQPSPRTVVLGHAVVYRIKVQNRGPDPALGVTLQDQPLGPARITGVHNPAGTCVTVPRVICRLHTINPGASVTLTVSLVPGIVTRSFVNRAVAGSATSQQTLEGNVATASVRVLAPPPPPPGRG